MQKTCFLLVVFAAIFSGCVKTPNVRLVLEEPSQTIRLGRHSELKLSIVGPGVSAMGTEDFYLYLKNLLTLRK